MEALQRAKTFCQVDQADIPQNLIPKKRERVKGQRDRKSKAVKRTFRGAALPTFTSLPFKAKRAVALIGCRRLP